MTMPATQKTIADELVFISRKLGAILPLWGVDPTTKTCLCPQNTGCKAAGKHPFTKLTPNGFKDATTDEKTIRNWVKRNPGGNWGLRTGDELPFGGYLFVIDVDSHGGDVDGADTLVDLEMKHGALPGTIRALTGGGGTHIFLRSPIQMGTRTLGPALDGKGEGGYIVLPPSLHKSGVEYRWEAGYHVEDIEIADAPEWVVGGATKANPRPDWNKSSAKDSLLGAAFEFAGMLGDELGEGKYAVRCVQAHLHSDGRGLGKDSSTCILPAIDGTSFGTFACRHSHCQQLKWSDVINALPAPAVQAAKLKYPLKPKLITPTPIPQASSATATLAPVVAPVLQLFKYKTTASGNSTIIPDQVNTQTMLQYDDEWTGVLKFDEFSQQIRFSRPPPWFPDDKPARQQDVWTDEDCARTMAYAMRKYDMALKEGQCLSAVQLVARRNSVHPVREYLNSLTWDNYHRVEAWAPKYLGTADTKYCRMVGRMWLIGCIARIMDPGCKSDHVIILEGPQGLRKSTALRTMAKRGEWFSDTPFDIGSKDAFLAIAGKWIVELAELDSFNRAEASRAKAFFSSPFDTFRPPYGRSSVSMPRQCKFAGSVNHGAYLRDETGNRRYHPILCGAIDIPSLERDVDQIWAEALVMYRQGVVHYPDTPEEHALCNEEQLDRAEGDSWTSMVADWLATTEADAIVKREGHLTIADVLTRGLRMEAKQQDKTSQMRIGKVLNDLGWKRIRLNGGKQYGYKK